MKKMQLLCGLLAAGSAAPDASRDVYQYMTFQGFQPEKAPVAAGNKFEIKNP